MSAEALPDDGAAIRAFKVQDAPFAGLAGDGHGTDRPIHRMQTEMESVSGAVVYEARRKRLRLDEEIAALNAANGRAVA